MTDAPREIWAYPHYDDGSPFAWTTGGWVEGTIALSDVVKYIRADIAEAEYKRGLEDAAKIAEEAWRDGCPVAEIPRIIRTKIQKKDD